MKTHMNIQFLHVSNWVCFCWLFLFTCYFNHYRTETSRPHTPLPQRVKRPPPPQPPAATRRTWVYDIYYTHSLCTKLTNNRFFPFTIILVNNNCDICHKKYQVTTLKWSLLVIIACLIPCWRLNDVDDDISKNVLLLILEDQVILKVSSFL